MKYLWVLVLVFLVGCWSTPTEPPMKIIKPVTIDETVLDSSNIAIDADGYPEWDADFKGGPYLVAGRYLWYHDGTTLTAGPELDPLPVLPSGYKTRVTLSKNGQYLGLSMCRDSGAYYQTASYFDKSYMYKRIILLDGTVEYEQIDFPEYYYFMKFEGNYLFCAEGEVESGITDTKEIHAYKYDDEDNFVRVPFNSIWRSITTGIASTLNQSIILIANKDTAGLQMFKRTGNTFDPFISPDDQVGNITSLDLLSDDSQLAIASIALVGINYTSRLTVMSFSDGETSVIDTIDVGNVALTPTTYPKLLYSPNGRYLAFTHTGSPYLNIYKREGQTYTELSVASNPGSTPHAVAWSADSAYLFVRTSSAQYVYSRSDDTFTRNTISTTLAPDFEYSLYKRGYSVGDVVRDNINLYESLIDGNSYALDSELTSSAWLDLGKINRWRMFDDYLSTYSEADDYIEVTLKPLEAGVDTVALFELQAESVTVERVGSGWDTTVTLSGKDTIVIDLDQAMTLGESVKIRIDDLGSTVQCGKLVLGISETIAQTLWDVESGVADYSKRQVDEWGRAYLKQGNWSKLMTATGLLTPAALDDVYRTLVRYRSTPVVWDFNEDSTDYSTLVAYGIYRDSRIILHGPNFKKLRIDILGLI